MNGEKGSDMNKLTKDFRITKNGVTAEISPCSFMYPNYGLQLQIRLVATGQTACLNIKKPIAKCTEEDANKLFGDAFPLETCGCGKPRFKKELAGNRAEQCEDCFVDALSAEYERGKKKEAAKVARKDKSMLAKGYTHKVVAWIHPAGDDYQVDIYFGSKPTDAEIQAHIKKQRSQVLDDYVLHDLAELLAKK